MSDLNDDIGKYRRGELSSKEMHELEKRALSDPFLADALEGVESINVDELSNDIDELNRRIQPNKESKRVYFTPLRIAAGVVVLISAGLFLFWPSKEAEQIAEQKIQGEAAVTATDTTQQQQKQLTLAEESKEEEQAPKQLPKKEKTKAPVQVETAPTVATVTKPDTTSNTIADDRLATESTTARADAAPVTKTTTIKGTVTVAEDGLPLPGVSIHAKGLALGTTTDINGNYTLTVPDSTSLIFSFVGMQTSEISVAEKSRLDVKMNEDVTQLSEVVITRSAINRPDNEEPAVILAEPVGGIKAYDKYMEDNLRYPQQALDNNVKGRVVVEFNVGIDGVLNNFVVMRSLGFGCDDEVIRLVKEGPSWRPTTEDNKPVMSSVRVRMKFDPAKAKKKR